MKYTFNAKNTVVTDDLKELFMKKMDRMARLFPEDTEVFVTFSTVKLENTVEITIPLNKRVLRSEVSTQDMYTSIDEALAALEKQTVKYKKRLKDKSRREPSFKEELIYMAFDDSDEYDDEKESNIVIERTKRFDLKPMDAEEAVMEMEMLGHNFFVFRDCDTDEVNVVYKRKNGTYGLIEADY